VDGAEVGAVDNLLGVLGEHLVGHQVAAMFRNAYDVALSFRRLGGEGVFILLEWTSSQKWKQSRGLMSGVTPVKRVEGTPLTAVQKV
jgi:hypothetical protein